MSGIFSMPEADASVLINIDLLSQTMRVSSDMGSYDWRISTARSGYRTPRGTYRPYQLLRIHYSHKYHMSPMPYSIFFAGGYAIHGTYRRHRSAVPSRTAAFDSLRAMPRAFSTWCKLRARRSQSPGHRHARAIMPGSATGGRPTTPCGAGNLTTRSPTHRRGVRQPRSGPGRPIPLSGRCRNGQCGREPQDSAASVSIEIDP